MADIKPGALSPVDWIVIVASTVGLVLLAVTLYNSSRIPPVDPA